MIPIPIDVDGLTVNRDVRTGAWILDGWGRTHRLREWTWAERRRLVDGCSQTGRLDTPGFLRALLALLVEPAPPPDATALYGCICLQLLGVSHAPRQSLTTSEVALARAFGWGPLELAGQPAGELDRLVNHLDEHGEARMKPPTGPTNQPARLSAVSPGSYSIVVSNDDSGGDHG